MKFERNNRYFQIALYAFGVIAASTLLALFLMNYSYFSSRFAAFFALLTPFVYGFVFSYLLNPCLNFVERKLLCRVDKPRLKRVLGLILTYLFVLLLIAVFLYIVAPQIGTSLAGLVSSTPAYLRQF